VAAAQAAVADILGRRRRVLVTGGSGFYLKAFLAPVTDDVVVPAEIRAEVAALPPDAARARLAALNPGGLGTMDTANPRRVVRALERCLASGRTLVELAASFARQPAPFGGHRIELTRLGREPVDLAHRIIRRVEAMLQAGLVEEVRRLRSEGLADNPSAARAIGYREVVAMLDGHLPAEALAAEIEQNTRALVKKQRTWFRTQLPPHRVLAADGLRDERELFGGVAQ
jgi:tRNA dimethylallyltransferase